MNVMYKLTFCQLFQNFYNYIEFVKTYIQCNRLLHLSDKYFGFIRQNVSLSRNLSIIIIALNFNKFIQLYDSKRNLNKQFKN